MAYRETALVRAKKLAARERILQAAHNLVARDGFTAVSVNDVAGLAEVATGSVYRHFPSKAELFSEVFRLACQREVDKVQEAIESQGSARDRLLRAAACFARRALRSKRLAYALIAEPIDPLVDADRLQYRQLYAEQFQRVVADGVANGEFPQQDPVVTSAALVGALAETLVGPLAPVTRDIPPGPATAAPFDEEHLVRSILNFCLRAVTAKETTA